MGVSFVLQNSNLFSCCLADCKERNTLPDDIKVKPITGSYFWEENYPEIYEFEMDAEYDNLIFEISLKLPDGNEIFIETRSYTHKTCVELNDWCKDFGVYYLCVRIKIENEEIGHFVLPFAHIKNSSKIEKCGACTHLIYFDNENTRRVIDIMQKAGLTCFRDDIIWEHCEKEKGQIKTLDSYTKIIDYYIECGLEPNINLLYGNALHTKDSKTAPVTDEEINAYVKFAETIAEIYKQKVFRFEIWNEYDLDCFNHTMESPETYTKMLKETYTAIKKANPKAKVIAGATCNSHIGWLERMLSSGGAKYCDGISIHLYSMNDFVYPDNQLQIDACAKEYQDIAKKYGLDTKIDLTEIGWSTYSGGKDAPSRIQQAASMVRLFATVQKSQYIGNVYQYDFRNDTVDVFNRESNWGMIEAFDIQPLAPKESYVAVCCYGNMISGFEFDSDYVKDGIQVIEFKSNNASRYMLWSLCGEKRISIKSSYSCVYTDMYGNEHNCDGEITVSENPCYITAKDRIEITNIGVVIAQSNHDFLVSVYPKRSQNGWNVNVKVYCNNAGQKGSLRIEIPELSLITQYKSFALKKGENSELSFEVIGDVLPPKLYRTLIDIVYAGGKREILQENISFISVPFGKNNFYKFALNENDYTFYEKGDKPISAEINMSYDNEYFYFTADVFDENHSQHGTYGNMWHDIWDGDYIQLILQPLANTKRGETRFNDFGFCLSSDTGKEISWRWHTVAGKSVANQQQLPVKITHSNGITHYDIKLPWNEILPDWISLRDCDKFGFALKIGNSSEEYSGSLTGYLSAFGGIGGWRSPFSYIPDEFGTIVLEKNQNILGECL